HSPIQELSTNTIEWHEVRGVNQEGQDNIFIQMTFDVLQLTVNSKVYDMNASTKFAIDIPFTDQYYYTRVFVKDEFNKWKEIPTTHARQIYDPTKITAVLRVTDTLNVSIPEIYNVDASSSSKIRI